MAQPNILLIFSDQHRYDCVAAHGHPLIETPNLDRLVREGIDFTQAYTPIPVCVPARNSLLVGQWSTEHHCIANTDTEAPRPGGAGAAHVQPCPERRRILPGLRRQMGCTPGEWADPPGLRLPRLCGYPRLQGLAQRERIALPAA